MCGCEPLAIVLREHQSAARRAAAAYLAPEGKATERVRSQSRSAARLGLVKPRLGGSGRLLRCVGSDRHMWSHASLRWTARGTGLGRDGRPALSEIWIGSALDPRSLAALAIRLAVDAVPCLAMIANNSSLADRSTTHQAQFAWFGCGLHLRHDLGPAPTPLVCRRSVSLGTCVTSVSRIRVGYPGTHQVSSALPDDGQVRLVQRSEGDAIQGG
jgi:hypothetical protein